MCEAHHVVPWQDGGPTDQHNLVLLCSRHHHVFHQPGWKVVLGADARMEVVDPTGRHCTTDPPPW
jgi:predicted restriction endonuclease